MSVNWLSDDETFAEAKMYRPRAIDWTRCASGLVRGYLALTDEYVYVYADADGCRGVITAAPEVVSRLGDEKTERDIIEAVLSRKVEPLLFTSVGEHGEELVRLPPGAQVVDVDDSASSPTA